MLFTALPMIDVDGGGLELDAPAMDSSRPLVATSSLRYCHISLRTNSYYYFRKQSSTDNNKRQESYDFETRWVLFILTPASRRI